MAPDSVLRCALETDCSRIAYFSDVCCVLQPKILLMLFLGCDLEITRGHREFLRKKVGSCGPEPVRPTIPGTVVATHEVAATPNCACGVSRQ